MSNLMDDTAPAWVVFVAGREKIQKGLLASFLEREFGYRCQVAEDDEQLPSPEFVGDCSLLVIRDCTGENSETLFPYLDRFGDRLLHDEKLCFTLVNLDPRLGVDAEMLRRGVRGVLNADVASSLMKRFVSSVTAGELWFPRQLVSRCLLESRGGAPAAETEAETPPAAVLPVALTVREKEVLIQIGMGATNEQIADRLCISQHTVKSHIYRIFRKINVPNRLQAALWASKYLA
jgi:LuxR family transcriptional regulator of csgAB operon